ncbi:MAG: hypothetical protein ACYTFA_11390 [Planctomycetota bacterium]|jgi:hypothetical protein
MKGHLAAIGITFILVLPVRESLLAPALGQLVSVECCITYGDLLTIGECLSGPVVTEVPDGCGPVGTCVISFGENQDVAAYACAPDQPGIPHPPRAYCTDWSLEGVEPEHECLADHNSGLDLFATVDADGDGDLDLRDVALFLETLEPVPRVRQSKAHVVSVECCLPAVELLRIGECMSGPGLTHAPGTCRFPASCTIGFSEPVYPGDFLHHLCGTGPPEPPDPADAFCASWYQTGEPAADVCEVDFASGVGSFVTFDSDGDGDLDLADLAVYQREFGSPTEPRIRPPGFTSPDDQSASRRLEEVDNSTSARASLLKSSR